jgi:hypothetical protein
VDPGCPSRQPVRDNEGQGCPSINEFFGNGKTHIIIGKTQIIPVGAGQD